MNENPILISDPSVMDWVVGFALPVGLGIVGVIVVYRTARLYKRLSSERGRKGKSSGEKP